MKTLNKDILNKHIVDDLKIESDDIVFLFSAVWGLGRLEGGLDTITNTFSEVLSNGLLVIPTFSYSWAKGESWDPKTTDCPDMGNYPNHAYKQPGFERTNDPNFSVSMLRTEKNSDLVDELLDVDMNCFGEKSIFAKLYKKAKSKERRVFVVLLGGAFNDCLFRCTFFHLVQQKHGIPYRYLKEFHDPDGKISEPVRQFSRYLSMEEYKEVNSGKEPPFPVPADEDFTPFGEAAKEAGHLTICDLNYYPTRMMEVSTLCDFFEEQVIADPLCYLKN